MIPAMHRRNASLLTAVLVMTVASAAAAQAVDGAIAGHVDDANAAPLPGVGIRIRCAAFERRTVTSADGNYTATAIPAGECVVVFELPGFKVQTRRARVDARATTAVSATLRSWPRPRSRRHGLFFLPIDASFAYSVARDSTNVIAFPSG